MLLGSVSCGFLSAFGSKDDADNPGNAATVDEPEETKAARTKLVSSIAAAGKVKDPAVLEALSKVKRHEFVPAEVSVELAYQDQALSIGPAQTMLPPSLVAELLEALQLSGDDRVLLIGIGTGYPAAVLASLCRHVDVVEPDPKLGQETRARLLRLGYRNIDVHVGEGYKGWPAGAPYERILLTAAPIDMPAALVDELAPYGILVGPLGPSDDERLVRWRKMNGQTDREDLRPIHMAHMRLLSD
jgi:protein-L-isoaspartate(D-aspartate) O-methyltransferase